MAIAGCWLKLGYRLGWLRKTSRILCSAHPSSLPYFGSNQACVHSSLLESRLPTAFMLVLLALQPRELFFLGPRSGVLYMGLKPVTPPVIPLLFLSPFPGAQVPTRLVLFSSYPVLCGSFLQLWLYRSLSVNLRLGLVSCFQPLFLMDVVCILISLFSYSCEVEGLFRWHSSQW